VSAIRQQLALSAFTRAWTQGFLLALAIESSYIVGDQHYFILDLSMLPLLVVGCLPTELSALLFLLRVRFIFRKRWYLFIPNCLLLIPIFWWVKPVAPANCFILFLLLVRIWFTSYLFLIFLKYFLRLCPCRGVIASFGFRHILQDLLYLLRARLLMSGRLLLDQYQLSCAILSF
jgi:hypothetical protein